MDPLKCAKKPPKKLYEAKVCAPRPLHICALHIHVLVKHSIAGLFPCFRYIKLQSSVELVKHGIFPKTGNRFRWSYNPKDTAREMTPPHHVQLIQSD